MDHQSYTVKEAGPWLIAIAAGFFGAWIWDILEEHGKDAALAVLDTLYDFPGCLMQSSGCFNGGHFD